MKSFVSFVTAIGCLTILAILAFANDLPSGSASVDCSGYMITVNAGGLEVGTTFTIIYTFTLKCGGTTTPVTGSIVFTATAPTATVSATGTWGATPLTSNCTVTAIAVITSSLDHTPITINGSPSGASLNCGVVTGGKSFSIGPSSMEGDLHISPGDWISGGYNFKFTDGNHAATMYTVEVTVTVPVRCPDNTVENIVIPLGAPGQLDGGGVNTFTYSIPAGNTHNFATGDQNSILTWAGAVQAPANLCGGQTGRNQVGAVFNATVLQSPHVGLVDWQFHYRDPNAKGKGNVNCTDATDPRRNRADVCGASWSQTLRDP